MRPPAPPRVPPKPAVAKPATPSAAAGAGPGRTVSAKTRAEAAPRTAPVSSPATEPAARPRIAAAPQPATTRPARGRPTVSTAMERRLAEKHAMRRHRVLKMVGIWSAVAVVVGTIVWGAFFSPLLTLDVERVEIAGQGSTIDVAQVQSVVAARAGTPLPRLDTVDLRNQILELNGVKDVAITREWPHGLGITLTSREPAVAVPAEGGVALFDAEGVRVGTAAERPEGLPLVEVGLEPKDGPALQAALHVLAGLPEDLLPQVTQVTASTRDDVCTTLASGQVVRWGSDERMALKVAVVQSLRQQAPDVHEYDVSSPDLPVTR